MANMRSLFYRSNFNCDISKWDVSNVTHMICMFANSVFDGDISKWNVNNVTYMDEVFKNSVISETHKPKFTNVIVW